MQSSNNFITLFSIHKIENAKDMVTIHAIKKKALWSKYMFYDCQSTLKRTNALVDPSPQFTAHLISQKERWFESKFSQEIVVAFPSEFTMLQLAKTKCFRLFFMRCKKIASAVMYANFHDIFHRWIGYEMERKSSPIWNWCWNSREWN